MARGDMTPIPAPWAVVVVVALNLCVGAYVLGANRMSRYQDERIEWVIAEKRRLSAVLRTLYETLGYEYPPRAGEPEDVPDWLTEHEQRDVPEVVELDSTPETQPIVIPVPTDTVPTHRAITPEAIAGEPDWFTEWRARLDELAADRQETK